jgi:RimJ/RimL family protein N-acetyltransferase
VHPESEGEAVHIHARTARLIIRRFTSADEDNMVRLNSDPVVMHYISGGLAIPGRAEIRDEVIPFHLAAYDRHPGFGTWAADDANTSRFVGWFHLRPRRTDGAIDLGYRLSRATWGKGLATEGSRALIDKAFIEHGIDRIVAETMTVNAASRRVMEKCDMTLIHTGFDLDLPPIDGADQGYVEYELTREAWNQNAPGG